MPKPYKVILDDALRMKYLKIKIRRTQKRAVLVCKHKRMIYNVLRRITVICANFLSELGQNRVYFNKKQGGLRHENGLFLDKKWPSCFPKACLLDDNVNIVYRRKA